MKRRRRRLPKKLEHCVLDVKARRQRKPVNPYAVCRASVGRRRNPRSSRGVALYARAPDGTKLKYVGGIKFAKRGAPVRFADKEHADDVKDMLKDQFPVLRKFKLWAA